MKLDRNNNKNKLYIIIIVGLLFLFVVGISFAYFQTQYGNGGKVDLKAKTYSVDELSFNIGEDITLNPNQFNFAQGKGNLEGATNASAILKANNKTHLAKMNYYAYVVVTKNEFKYTTSDKKAELVLSVEGPNGVVTTLPDLGNAIDVTDNEGNTFKAFDITEFSGVITLADNKEIEVVSSDNGKKQEDWKIKVTFINLDADQSSNSDKSFNANMMIQKEKFAGTMADICKGQLLTDCVSAQYYVLKNHNGLYYHDGTITDSNSNVIDAGDNSYRYAGANPNNYICFGSDEETCSAENLYRIIGLIDGKVKLILADGATTDMLGTDGGYYNTYEGEGLVKSKYKGSGDLSKIGIYKWNKTGTNTWDDSETNLTNLNANFLTYLDGKSTQWRRMIDNTTWYIGGLYEDVALMSIPNITYSYEVGANKDESTTVTSKIGLMYISDFFYGASKLYWTSKGSNYSGSISNNWMCIGLVEWTITSLIDSPESLDSAFRASSDGLVNSYPVKWTGYVLRPTFNLIYPISYSSGSGTVDDPIRIRLNK